LSSAVPGGFAGNGEPLHVCRGNINGQQTPGKLYKPTGCCYVGSNGSEHCLTDYLVLASGEGSKKSSQSILHREKVTIYYSNIDEANEILEKIK
jgi:hypothetical protein